MIYILEKKYINQDMNIELISYIDNKQNIWFEGKDIAKIFGYSKPRNAIERHVSKNHIKMIQLCWGPETGRQQNASNCWDGKTPPQQNDTRGKWCTFIDEAGFYELVFSSKLEAAKNSVIGYSLQSSHQSVNMANKSCLIVPGIK